MMKLKEMALIGLFENAKELNKTDESTTNMEMSHYSRWANKQANKWAAQNAGLNTKNPCLSLSLYPQYSSVSKPILATGQENCLPAQALPPFCLSECFF